MYAKKYACEDSVRDALVGDENNIQANADVA